MNKRSLTLIMAIAALVLCLLSPFAGAVTISYTADSGGESVSINENYDVDNSVTVKETTDISFGNLQVDQERTAEGTGESDLEQAITGKTADGTQYTAENDILSEGTINAKTSTSATGNTLGVAQTVSVTGDARLRLEGEEGGNLAGQYARVENGSVSSRQALVIGNSVHTSQDTSIRGENPMAFGGAGDLKADLITGTIDGGGAVIGAGVLGDGEMDACFSADTSHSASASGSITAEGDVVVGGAGAGNIAVDLATGTVEGEGAVIGAGVLGDGEMDACFSADTSHSASASGSITAEGDVVVGGAGAGNIAVDLATGTVEGEGAVIGAGVLGDGEMDACFSADTSHSASASGSITAEGDVVVGGAGAGNIAVDLATGTVEGEGAVIGAGVLGDGEMDACFSADTSHSASASGSISAEGDLVAAGAGAGNIAVDLAAGTVEGEGAVIGAGGFGIGEMDASFSADTSHSASASGSISAEGDLVAAGAGAGNIAVDLATGTVEGEGAVIGAGVLGDGEMDASFSADTSHSASASGSISAEGDLVAAGAGAGNIAVDLATGTVEGEGAVIGAGVLGDGEMDASFSADTSHSASASGSISAEGDLVAAGAGAGNIAVDLAAGTVEGEGAVIGAGVLGDGEMDASFSADTSHSASASGSISAEGDLVAAGAGAGNIAVDLAEGTVEGEGAVIGAGVLGDGEMDASFSADTSHSASASGSITAEGLGISAIVGAVNQYGYTFIENEVTDGTLYSESEAIANEDEAFCSQEMNAEGSYIYKFVEADNFAGPYASDTTEVWDGTLAASSTATVNETSAVVTDPMSARGFITKSTYAESRVGYTEIDLEVDNGTLNGEFLGKASDVEAFCSQDMNFTGDLDERIGGYNVVMSAELWAHIWSTVPIEDPVDLWSNATVNETNIMINIGVGISP